MAKPSLSRSVIIGVDLGASAGSSAGSARERFTRFLLDRLDSLEQPSSWFASHLDQELVGRIRSRGMRHEIALAAPEQPQGLDSITLRRQLRQAETLELRVESYALDVRRAAPLELLSRAGIRTLRPTRVQSSLQVSPIQPQATRFGMWGIPVSIYLPHTNRLADHFVMRQLMMGLRHAVQQNRCFHIVLDVATFASQGTAGERSIERLLQYIQQLRRSEDLQMARLMDVQRMVQQAMAGHPTQSILRRIAA